MEGASHDAVAIGGSSGYQVFRDVKDFGAVGDGRTDDTVAINLAISSDDRYLDAGLPIIGAASSFIGLGATSSNVYIEGQGGGRLWGSDASGLTYSEDAGSFGGEDRNRVVIISTARDGPQGQTF
ncbi:hypothetical protein TWF173_004817 [Orbilia oligospora]|nr:hypothetical protein TWF173_004817 [Orbilia oligospora]